MCTKVQSKNKTTVNKIRLVHFRDLVLKYDDMHTTMHTRIQHKHTTNIIAIKRLITPIVIRINANLDETDTVEKRYT